MGIMFQLRLNSSELRGSRVSCFVSAVGKVCGLFDLLGNWGLGLQVSDLRGFRG